ncbi:hypothetical protein QR685DRAFT_594054 [Neurospora intermedia]|uniref:DUF7580 domain-containing protein n=1 Tax=Neurospora intermedia TaxID=5142 RepID=A0ABR3DS43_NEUIN
MTRPKALSTCDSGINLSADSNAVRFIHALESDLTNEHCILTCTCELLLQGIAPTSKVDIMLKDPFGHEWKGEQFNRALRLRLGQSYSSIESGIENLKKLVDELVIKLGLGSDLKCSLFTKEDICSEIKKKTAFTLKKEDYDTVLARIQSTNSSLYRLVELNKGLEPHRRYRSQWRFTQLLRDISQSLSNAFDGATASCCARPHDACFKLNPRPLEMDPGSTEDEMAKDLDFSVSLELYTNGSISVGSTAEPSRWHNLSISIVSLGSRKADDHVPRTLSLRSSSTKPARQLSHKIGQSKIAERYPEGSNRRGSQSLLRHALQRIESKGKAVNAMIKGSLNMIIEPRGKQQAVGCVKTLAPSSVDGICQLIRMHEKYPATEHGRVFYGNIMDREDPERRFGLYAPMPLMSKGQHIPEAPPILRWQPSDLPSSLTLRQLLNRIHDARLQQSSSEPLLWLEFQDQLQLAVSIAVNILHLYSTPWLPRIITLDDIWFRLEDEPLDSHFPSGFPYRPFIKKSMPLSAASSAMPRTTGFIPRSRKRETTVFSFGLILIQIMLGRVINELDMKSPSDEQGAATPEAGQSTSDTVNNNVAAMSLNDYMEKHKLGKEFEGAVLAEAGPEYTSAVTRCLESFINIEGLQSEKFCQEFYVEVIAMLQEALDKSMEL